MSALLALSGCGTKTPLIMPPAPAKAPLLGQPPQALPGDHNNAAGDPQ
ncbi:MAG: lipoprotein [Sterolibacterium sp.]